MVDQFERMLNRLSGSQESIRRASAWMREHPDDYVEHVDCWLRHVRHPNTQALYRLSLLHLANDVIQRRNPSTSCSYLDKFKGCLPLAFEHLRDGCIRRRVQRVLQIWQSRQVFELIFIEALKAVLVGKWTIQQHFKASLIEDVARYLSENADSGGANDDDRATTCWRKNPNPDYSADVRRFGPKQKELINQSITLTTQMLHSADRACVARTNFLNLLDLAENHYALKYTEAARIYDTYERFSRRLNRSIHELNKVENDREDSTESSFANQKRRSRNQSHHRELQHKHP